MVGPLNDEWYSLSEVLTAYHHYGSSVRGLIVGLLLRGYSLPNIIKVLGKGGISPTTNDLVSALLEYGNGHREGIVQQLIALGQDWEQVARTLVVLTPEWNFLLSGRHKTTKTTKTNVA